MCRRGRDEEIRTDGQKRTVVILNLQVFCVHNLNLCACMGRRSAANTDVSPNRLLIMFDSACVFYHIYTEAIDDNYMWVQFIYLKIMLELTVCYGIFLILSRYILRYILICTVFKMYISKSACYYLHIIVL